MAARKAARRGSGAGESSVRSAGSRRRLHRPSSAAWPSRRARRAGTPSARPEPFVIDRPTIGRGRPRSPPGADPRLHDQTMRQQGQQAAAHSVSVRHAPAARRDGAIRGRATRHARRRRRRGRSQAWRPSGGRPDAAKRRGAAGAYAAQLHAALRMQVDRSDQRPGARAPASSATRPRADSNPAAGRARVPAEEGVERTIWRARRGSRIRLSPAPHCRRRSVLPLLRRSGAIVSRSIVAAAHLVVAGAGAATG